MSAQNAGASQLDRVPVERQEEVLHRSWLRIGWWSKLGWAALFCVLSAIVLLQSSPWVVGTPGNDNGIFLYFGQQILKGQLPFVDLWDHKPPLIFYIDALGFALGSGSRWGVWAMEVLALTTASLFGFFYARRYFRSWPAAVGIIGLLFNLAFVLEGGNLTEEYALPFQFAALFFFARALEAQKPGWRGWLPGLAVGAALGGAFLLKQTLIGVWVSLGIYLLIAVMFTRRYRQLLVLAQMVVGAGLVVLVSVIYFAMRGALGAYWDVGFWYNFVYSDVAPMDRLNSMFEVLVFLNTRSGFFILACTAWLAGWGFVLLNQQAALWQVTRRWVGLLFLLGGLVVLSNGAFRAPFEPYAFSALSPYRWSLIGAGLALLLVSVAFFSRLVERKVYPFLQQYSAACDSPVLLPVTIALIDLPVNLLMVSVSGRGYLHYYMSLFPALTILVAFLVWSLTSSGPRPSESRMSPVWGIALLLPVLMGGLLATVNEIHPGTDLQTTVTVAYIQQNTAPEDTVLLWGTQTGIYYLSGREAPTRYVHQIPLFNARYATPERLAEFLNDLQTRKPKLVIDTRLPSMPLVYQAGDPSNCSAAGRRILPGMDDVYAFICANYTPVGEIGPDSWIIYQYNPAIQ